MTQMIPRFGSGTSVSAYLRTQWQGGNLSGAPTGSAVATASVQTDGTLTFSGLAADTEYIAYAQVSSVDKYVSFRTGTGGSSATAKDVEVIPPTTSSAPTTATSVAATSTSAALLAANPNATYRQIVNLGSDTVTVKLGSGVVTDYAGIPMPANSTWDGCLSNGRLYTGALAVKTLTGTATVSVVEG